MGGFEAEAAAVHWRKVRAWVVWGRRGAQSGVKFKSRPGDIRCTDRGSTVVQLAGWANKDKARI